jgi:hypothetical protein
LKYRTIIHLQKQQTNIRQQQLIKDNKTTMNQVRRLIISIIAALLFVGVVTGAAGNSTCATEIDAYTKCYSTNKCACQKGTPTAFNTSTTDGACASALDATCQIATCCSNCTKEVNTYFDCLFTSAFPGQKCEKDCQKKTSKVKQSDATTTGSTVTTLTSTLVSAITISTIVIMGLVL